MKNVAFYLITVLIWGSTWIGIKMQLGLVDPMVSVAYRFALAALILLVFCVIRKLPMRFTIKEHFFMLLQGLLLFGFNYLFFYIAELSLTSGLAAVIFSTILLMNIGNGALILKHSIEKRVVAGGSLGLLGIILVFRPEITGFSLEQSGIVGILFCILATFLASLGNIASVRNQQHGLPIIQTNAYGMSYGALAMLVTAIILDKPFIFDFSVPYVASLLYLAIFGSIIAFGCYLTLVGNIGADRAAYATLLFPIVALAISTVWEGYLWTVSSATGVVLIIIGNFWILKKKDKAMKKTISQATKVDILKNLRLRKSTT